VVVTREQARRIMARVRTGDLPFDRAEHFWESMKQERFQIQDVWAVLRSHRIEAEPEWDPTHRNHRVRLLGKCLQGRPTRVVLGIRADDSVRLITIMVAR
jgi:hypothetical protein